MEKEVVEGEEEDVVEVVEKDEEVVEKEEGE